MKTVVASSRTIGSLRGSPLDRSPGGRLVFFVALSLLNLSNMGTHLVLSRVLGPNAYGGLAAVLGLLAVISVPLSALQAAVARGATANPTASAQSVVVRAGVYGASATGVWLLATPSTASFLHLPIGTVILAAPWVLLSVVNVTIEGVLVGRARFRQAAWGLLIGTGVVRLVVGISLVEMGAGVDGGVAGSSIGAAVTTGLLLWMVRDHVGADSLKVAPGDVLRALSGVSGVTVLTSLDAWLARHFLQATQAGWFSAAATVGRTALFLPAALLMIFFPRFASHDGRGPLAIEALRNALLATAALSFGMAAVMVVAPHLVATVIFGSRFSGAAKVVGIVGLADACVACTTVLVYFQMARRSPLSSCAWVGCGVTVVLAVVFHSSATALAWVMLGVNATTLVATLACTAVAAQRDGGVPAPAGASADVRSTEA